MPLEGRGRREEREGRENNSVVGYSPVVAAWLESRSVYHINRYSKAGLTGGGGRRGEGGRASDSSVPQAIYRYTSAKRLASTVASPRARLALFIAGGSLTEYRYSSSSSPSSSSLSIDSASASISSIRLIRIRTSIGGGEFISVTSIFFSSLFFSPRRTLASILSASPSSSFNLYLNSRRTFSVGSTSGARFPRVRASYAPLRRISMSTLRRIPERRSSFARGGRGQFLSQQMRILLARLAVERFFEIILSNFRYGKFSYGNRIIYVSNERSGSDSK